MSSNVHVIVPAAGSGRRMQSSTPKQYLSLAGDPVLLHTLKRLISAIPSMNTLTVALTPGDEQGETLLAQLQTLYPTVRFIQVPGGAERSDSVLNALSAMQDIAGNQDWVLVHDAARPCVRAADIDQMMSVLNADRDLDGGLLAVPVSATLKRGDVNDCVAATVEREQMWAAATPQVFRYQALHSALLQARQNGMSVTDEASAMEAQGANIKLIPCQPDNIKITWQGDLLMAEAIMKSQATAESNE